MIINNFGTWEMCNTPEEIVRYQRGEGELHKVLVNSGVVGCGKSFSIAEGFGYYCMHLEALGIKNFNFVLAGQSQNSVKKNFCKELNKAFPGHFKYDGSTSDGIVKDARLFSQNLYIVGMSDSKSEERIRGLSDIMGCICEELTLFDEDQFNLMTARLRGEISAADAKLLPENFLQGWVVASTNPAGPAHWLVKYIRDGRFKVLKWLMEDACWNGAKQFYRDKIRQWKDTPVLYKRNLLGLWVSNDTAVYPGFEIKRHTYRDDDFEIDYRSFERNFLAVDAGSNHPTAILIISKTWSGEYVVSLGRRIQHTAPSDIAREIGGMYDVLMSMGRGHNVYVDPAAEWLKDELRKRGITPINAKNDHQLGINFVRGLLGEDKLLINYDTCEDLVTEMSNYSFKNKDSEEVIKVDDDFADALRYGVYTDSVIHGGL